MTPGMMCAAAQVVRVALMGLKNLLADASLDVGPEAVEAGLPKVVQQRLLQVCPQSFHLPPIPVRTHWHPCSAVHLSR